MAVKVNPTVASESPAGGLNPGKMVCAAEVDRTPDL